MLAPLEIATFDEENIFLEFAPIAEISNGAHLLLSITIKLDTLA